MQCALVLSNGATVHTLPIEPYLDVPSTSVAR